MPCARGATARRSRSARPTRCCARAILHHYFGLPGAPRDALGYPGRLARDAAARAVRSAQCRPAPRRSTATSASSAPARAAEPRPACSPRLGSTSSCSRPATQPEFSGEELESLRALYLEGAAAATEDQAVDVLAGWCLGGGTTVNWTTSLPPARRRARGVGGARRRRVRGGRVRAQPRRGRGADGRQRRARRGVRARPRARARARRRSAGTSARSRATSAAATRARSAATAASAARSAPSAAPSRRGSPTPPPLGARVLVGVTARRVLVERGSATGVDAGPRAGACACGRRRVRRVPHAGAPAAFGPGQREHRAQPSPSPRHPARG